MAFSLYKLIDRMVQPEMIPETIALTKLAAEHATTMDIIFNNRSGGNAPMIA
jgi:hypothetical protein